MVGVTFPDAIAGIMEMPSVQVLERLAQPFLTVKHETMPGVKKKGGEGSHVEAIRVAFDSNAFADKVVRALAEAPARFFAGDRENDSQAVVAAVIGMTVEIICSYVTSRMQEAIERVHDTQSPNGVLRRYADLVPHGFFENGGAE